MSSEGQGLIYKNIYPLTMVPGILRDGTTFSRPNWIAGQWVRFYRGVPRKMGGYQQISGIPPASGSPISPFFGPLDTLPRGLYVVPASPDFNVYVGNANGVGYTPIDFFGNPTGGFVDRTPRVPPFAGNINNAWQFDVMFSALAGENTSVLIAFAAPNLTAVDSAIQRPVYYGDAFGTAPLIPTGTNVSGGILCLQPYLFLFDNDGLVLISEPNNPTVIADSFRIAPYKLVAGLPVRGGNTSPAGLIWSLDRLIRVTNVGTPTGPEWNFDTVSADVSIMSATCMIEFDSQYYWMGVDRFYIYNGVVTELPNNMSWEYLFNNLNYAQRQKVWVTKVTAWGEIWWFYPMGESTECNAAVIYNVREQAWYDTSVTRSCGYYASTFAQPIWADNTQLNSVYPVWLQEQGTDISVGNTLSPLLSSITSGTLSWIGTDPNKQRRGMDRWMSLYRFEPDFVQSGDMTMTINFQDYPASTATYTSGPYTFHDDTVKIDINTPRQGREVTITLESNVVGGDYEMGECLLVAMVGDGRQSVPTS